ncbi:cell surface glycoprotein 1 [Drosophila montana]|uniref:cell surface glycoprotein 1 n=1 Tax=Drosophila montana TaxID=40370 RepID=UPI00313E0C72
MLNIHVALAAVCLALCGAAQAGDSPHPCSRTGFVALVDNAQEYFACEPTPNAGYSMRRLRCQDNMSFNSELAKCVERARDAVAADGSDIENPTIPPGNFEDSTEDPDPTNAPSSTKEPEPTDAPGSTKEPEPTDAPGSTKEPEPTDAPGSTKEPEPTDAPGSTKEPEPTDAPGSTKEPEPTDAPGSTKEPGTTDTPGSTKEPEPTDAPSSTKEPGTTDAPGSTKEPEPTDAPGSTNEPGTTDAPGSTKEPESTDAPGSTNEPGTTDAPGSPSPNPNPTTEQPGTSTTVREVCATTGFLPKNGNCDQYIICYEDDEGDLIALTQDCPVGMQFNPDESCCELGYDCTNPTTSEQ